MGAKQSKGKDENKGEPVPPKKLFEKRPVKEPPKQILAEGTPPVTNYLLPLPGNSNNPSVNITGNSEVERNIDIIPKRSASETKAKPATAVNPIGFSPVKAEKKAGRGPKPRFSAIGGEIDSRDKQMENIAKTLGELENESIGRQRSRKATKASRKTHIDEYLMHLHMGMDEYERLLQEGDKSVGLTNHSKGASSQYTLKVNSEKHHITLHTMMKIMSVNEFNWLKSTRNMAKTRSML